MKNNAALIVTALIASAALVLVLAVDGNRITVGFDEIEYKEVWS